MSNICNDCGDEYQRIGQHWAMSSCEPLQLSDEQKQIVTGLMMGDGTISRSNKGTCRIEANMISKEYLEYLDSQFPLYGSGVRLVNSAEENAKRDRESGFNPSAEADDYSDTYRWTTVTSTTFDAFGDWYDSGEKVWPSDIELTPTVLKHLYCGDGYYRDDDRHDNITISMNNEKGAKEKVAQMFEDADLPVPRWVEYSERGRDDCTARFSKDESTELLEYMGEPLPGFEYKWPTSFRF